MGGFILTVAKENGVGVVQEAIAHFNNDLRKFIRRSKCENGEYIFEQNWVELTENYAYITELLNGWTMENGNELRISRIGNLVFLKGSITGGVKTSGTQLFNIPSKYAPKGLLYFSVDTPPNRIECMVYTSGLVTISSTNDANNYIKFNIFWEV